MQVHVRSWPLALHRKIKKQFVSLSSLCNHCSKNYKSCIGNLALLMLLLLWCWDKACFHFQGSTWEGKKAQGWGNKEPVLPHCLHLQLCLLCSPRLPLYHANLPLLDMLDLPPLHSSPAVGLGALRAWTRGRRPRLVYHFLLPWEPACKPMVRHCKCGRRICNRHVCHDTHHLLA